MGIPVKAPSHDDHRIFLRYQLFPYAKSFLCAY
jgi:hypothetical protein